MSRRLQVVYRRPNVGAAAVHAPTMGVVFTSKEGDSRAALAKLAKRISAEGVMVTHEESGRAEWIAPACIDRIEDLGEKPE